MSRILCGLALASIFVFAAPVHGDWDPGDGHKMHYPQLPDLDFGQDVLNGPYVLSAGSVPPYSKFLADDFLCTQTGPITDLHVWGSWWDDLNPPALQPKTFAVGIFANILPGVGGIDYSRPGRLLWQARLQPTERLYTIAQEEFFDPNQNAIVGGDTQVWQYNFDIPADEAFEQKEGEIYWLGMALLADVNGDFVVDTLDIVELPNLAPFAYGWKTSQDRFEDAAVWSELDPLDPTIPVDPVWRVLVDPRTTEPLQLAFVITPEPASIAVLAGGLVLLMRRR